VKPLNLVSVDYVINRLHFFYTDYHETVTFTYIVHTFQFKKGRRQPRVWQESPGIHLL